MSVNLSVNGKQHTVDVEPDTPLLWVLRDTLGLTGTKYSCGIGICGACTVHLNGMPVRSCDTTLAEADGSQIKTIEGLAEDAMHQVQLTWIEGNVAQCGYCQAGQIMSAAHLVDNNPSPSEEDIEQAMQGNICRCGTYNRIKEAIYYAVEIKNADS